MGVAVKAKVTLNNQAFNRAITVQASPLVRDAGDDLKRLIIQSFGLAKTGRVYFRPKVAGGGPYRASAPGEAPAIRSGNLFRNLKLTMPAPLTVELLIDTEYAAFLEDGVVGRMAARPFVEPAIENMTARFNNNLTGLFA